MKGLIQQAIKFQESDEVLEVSEKSEKAKSEFEKFPVYQKKKFIESIQSAKRGATKQRRFEKSMELICQGIGLHDKYR